MINNKMFVNQNHERVNKKELVKKIKQELGKQASSSEISLTEINAVLDSTVSTILSCLKQGRGIFWSGMGSFMMQKRKPTTRRNPQNGQEIKIPGKEVAKMKLFKSFTEKCVAKSTKKAVKTQAPKK